MVSAMGLDHPQITQIHTDFFQIASYLEWRVGSDSRAGRTTRTREADRGASHRFAASLNNRFPLGDLLRQPVYSRLAGSGDLNDAVRVSADQTFRLIGSKKNWHRGAALTSRLQSFEAGMLPSESGPRPTRGQRLQRPFRVHLVPTRCCCSTRTVIVWRRGCDRVTCPAPRTGTSCCCTEIERPQAEGKRAPFRADAAFAKPEIYEAVEESGVDYAIRIPAYKNLELGIEDIQFRPPGRPSRKPFVRYKGFRYQAESWSQPRRIVAKVEHHLGELFPRLGFIVTNMLAKPLGGAFLQQARHGGAVGQGRQAGNELDQAVMPSLPSKRGVATALPVPGG